MLPNYLEEDESENSYNRRIASLDSSLFCLDGESIFYGGKQSQIEVCDLLSTSNRFIHVKRYSGSQTLSHLFSQGLVSAEAFSQDKKFRRDFNARLPESHKLTNADEAPSPSEWTITYAIVTKSSGSLELPFFSKVTLRNAVRLLNSMSFHVEVVPILDVNPSNKGQRRKLPSTALRSDWKL